MILLDRWELMAPLHRRRLPPRGRAGLRRVPLGAQLDQAVASPSSHGAQVVLLTAAVHAPAETPDGGLYDEDQPARVDAWNKLPTGRGGEHPDPHHGLDLNKRVCPDGVFTGAIGGLQIRSDGLHFTAEGVQQWIAPWLLPQLTDWPTGCHPTAGLGQPTCAVSLTVRTATLPSGQ